MDQIDEILEKYEEDLQRAEARECKKVSQCVDFRNIFRKEYDEQYRPRLEEVVKKLHSKGHSARIEEKPPEDVFFGFTFFIIPRHLYRFPFDKYFPSCLWSSISFVANEHTLSVDVETTINPNMEREENNYIEKIPKNDFSEVRLMDKVSKFLQKVFDETIILDYKPLYESLTGP
ncbi:MAG: hypothetical protein JRJ85_22770 [Deltaproteobacteria bacterium]|nr:hypothetical protein [Deltaproteobacteria bacterium]